MKPKIMLGKYFWKIAGKCQKISQSWRGARPVVQYHTFVLKFARYNNKLDDKQRVFLQGGAVHQYHRSVN